MFCKNCGQSVCDQAVICPHCGVAIQEQAEQKGNGMAIAGFVCSFFMPILGWVFGGVGLARASKRKGKGKGFSIAAIAIATVNFVVALSIL
ncbi:MAG: hypothetical protein J6A38_00760 [Clostridia bacterium]|nr:hypothetical protein [Clostridia bacterium]